MILSAHQPAYLPWLGLFHKIAMADQFVIYDHVPRSNRDFTARNRVKTANGVVDLIVPLKGHADTPLFEVEIDNSQPWRRKHWRTIELAYRKAPYWNEYVDYLWCLYQSEYATITHLNATMFEWFYRWLGIPHPIQYSSTLGIVGTKSEGVLDMCRKLGATGYIFGAKGRDYADIEAFKAAGVTPYFQDYHHPAYPQLHGPFVPNLSIIDLLFNCGPKSLEMLMNGNIKDLSREP